MKFILLLVFISTVFTIPAVIDVSQKYTFLEWPLKKVSGQYVASIEVAKINLNVKKLAQLKLLKVLQFTKNYQMTVDTAGTAMIFQDTKRNTTNQVILSSLGGTSSGRFPATSIKYPYVLQSKALQVSTFLVSEKTSPVLGLGSRFSPEYSLMYQLRYFESKTYSLNLDPNTSHNSLIIFGGIDTAKFKAPLSYSKMLSTSDSIRFYTNEISFLGKAVVSQPVETIISSLDDKIQLPSSMVQKLVSSINPNMKCEGSLLFHFGDTLIAVPLLQVKTNKLLKKFCDVNVEHSKTNTIVLGKAFLNYVYVNVDLDEQKVGFAPSVSTSKSEIALYPERKKYLHSF